MIDPLSPMGLGAAISEADINWQPRVPLKTGLERTIAYFEGVLTREIREEQKLVGEGRHSAISTEH